MLTNQSLRALINNTQIVPQKPKPLYYKIVNPQIIYYDPLANELTYFGQPLYFKTTPLILLESSGDKSRFDISRTIDLRTMMLNVEKYIERTYPVIDVISGFTSSESNELILNGKIDTIVEGETKFAICIKLELVDSNELDYSKANKYAVWKLSDYFVIYI